MSYTGLAATEGDLAALNPRPGWSLRCSARAIVLRRLAFRDGVWLRLLASRADGPGIEARVVEAGRLLLGGPVRLS
jgi:hypothetical protein